MAKTTRKQRKKIKKIQMDIYNKKFPKGKTDADLYGGELIDLDFPIFKFKEGGKVMKYKKGGKIDGAAIRGKTRARMV